MRTWADSKHLRISPEALDAKLLAAGEGQLVRPPARRPLSASGAPAPRSAFANTDLSFDGGSDLSLDDDFGPGPSGKRGGGHLSEAPSAKKQRVRGCWGEDGRRQWEGHVRCACVPVWSGQTPIRVAAAWREWRAFL